MIKNNGLMQLELFSRKWFPEREITVDSMAEGLFLEQDFWDNMSVAVANGIAKAFKG
ncbi:DUF6890 family protein [Maridesulfovibrio sp.]|uniref:DUF6890 family protein n=1 Tax=Maridesulfovibrio sp. TaxID=2795000 RepID=UPI0029CA1C9B|nr:hypothetical protein [Maridesulfovibrio sp.]